MWTITIKPRFDQDMSDPITAFLAERLADKSKNKEGDDLAKIQAKFELRRWVADAASRAWQLNRSSHPGKFSHPDAKISSILFHGDPAVDGLVRSGNVRCVSDVVGNAAALDVYTFLMLRLNDDRTVLDHFESRSSYLRELLAADEEAFESLAAQFMKVKTDEDANHSSGKVKQIYFPVNDGYHLLSVLTPSGIISANSKRIENFRFSDQAKTAREARKKKQASEHGVVDFIDPLTMHFGGTKPWNISKLNNNNGGRALLFRSLPPMFSADYVRVPRNDFFREVRWDEELKHLFKKLHGLLMLNKNDVSIRDQRKRRIEQIVDWLLIRAYQLQTHKPGWSESDVVQLPVAQVVWLDRKFHDQQDQNLSWANEIDGAAADWILRTYQRLQRKQKAELGEEVRNTLAAEIRDYTRLSKEQWA